MDATSVYFGTAGDFIMKVPLEGGAPTTLVQVSDYPGFPDYVGGVGAIVVDSTNVYWTNVTPGGGNFSVRKTPK